MTMVFVEQPMPSPGSAKKKDLSTLKSKSSLAAGFMIKKLVESAEKKGFRPVTILLCSLRKSVCMEASVGWTVERTSPDFR